MTKELLNPKQKHNVQYKNKFYPRNAKTRAKHMSPYRFKPGESGQSRAGKKAHELPDGTIEWVDNPNGKPLPDGIHLWEPGESGNPKGRPIGAISVVERLRAYLRRHPEEIEELVIALIKEGRLGNLGATKEIMDRVDGRVVEKHILEGELPITIRFVPAAMVLGNGKRDVIEGQATEIKQIEKGE